MCRKRLSEPELHHFLNSKISSSPLGDPRPLTFLFSENENHKLEQAKLVDNESILLYNDLDDKKRSSFCAVIDTCSSLLSPAS